MTDSDKAWALANICLEQGRIHSSVHGHYLQSGKADYAATLGRLAALPVGKYPINSTALSYDKLRREAPQQLEQIRREQPSFFAALQDLHVAELKAKQSSKSSRS